MVYDRSKKGWSQFINGLFAPMSFPNHSHKGTANALVFSSKIFLGGEKKATALDNLKTIVISPHLPASLYFTVSMVLTLFSR